jgi:hypothetical protein
MLDGSRAQEYPAKSAFEIPMLKFLSAALSAMMKPAPAMAATRVGITTVDTVSELQALLPSDQPVYVLGYHAANDDGGGMFYWIPNNATTQDDGHVFQSTHASTPSGRWHRILESPWVNVKHFGAMDNDSVDSTPAFEKAIAAASLVHASESVRGGVAGGTIVVPAGNYVIGDLIVDRPVALIGVAGDGAGHGGTTLRVRSGVNSRYQIDYDSGVDGWSGQDNLALADTTVPSVPPPLEFEIGARVQVVNTTINVRETPGGTLLGTQPVGSQGTVLAVCSKPYHGIIVVSGASQIRPNSLSDGAIIANFHIRPQRRQDGSAQGTAENSPPATAATTEYTPDNGGCGIFIESGSQITIRNVSIYFMKGHGIAITYAETFGYHNRIEGAWIYGNQKDGIYISGGINNSHTVGVSISTVANGGYGIREKSYNGATFISCQAELNLVGSFKQAGSHHSGSVYIGCYWEGEASLPGGGAPDMIAGLFVGGLASRHGKLGTYEERIGKENARLGFMDEGYRGQYHARIPSGIHESIFKFRYQPNLPAGAITGPTTAHWMLRRRSDGAELVANGSTAEVTYTTFQPGSAMLPRYERCWLFELETIPAFISPLGWTDELHPRGPGHLFFGKPLINQRCHWTLRKQATLQRGRNIVSIPVEDYWLIPESGSELGMAFSIDVTGQSLASGSAQLDLRTGAHSVVSTSTGVNNVEVVVYNDGAAEVTATIVARAEHAKRWYTSTNLG